MLQYSIYEIISAYQENKDIIDAYIKNHPIELYTDKCDCTESPTSDDCKAECATILGLSVGLFVVVAIITFIIWVIAIYVLVKNAQNMPQWAIILCVLFLVFGGWFPMSPIIVIVLASVIKK